VSDLEARLRKADIQTDNTALDPLISKDGARQVLKSCSIRMTEQLLQRLDQDAEQLQDAGLGILFWEFLSIGQSEQNDVEVNKIARNCCVIFNGTIE